MQFVPDLDVVIFFRQMLSDPQKPLTPHNVRCLREGAPELLPKVFWDSADIRDEPETELTDKVDRVQCELMCKTSCQKVAEYLSAFAIGC